MNASVRSVVLLVLAIGCAVPFLWMLSERRANPVVSSDGTATDIHKMSPETLEREIRGDLPMGTSLSGVEEYLKKRGIESGFEAQTKTIYATIRKLKGSTMITIESLTLRFYFDDLSKLTSIDAKVSYTGP